MIRTGTVALAAACVALAWTNGAHAASCNDLANNCMRSGGTKDRCFAADVMANCRNTCVMIGPYSGKPFKATSGCRRQ